MTYVVWPAIDAPGAGGVVVVVVAGTVGMVTKFVGLSGRIVVLLDVPLEPLPHAPSARPPATASPATMRRERMAHEPTAEPPARRGTRGSDQRSGGWRYRSGELGLAHQPRIHAGSARAALGDRPDDQALPATHVAGDEDAGDVGHVPRVAGDVAALVVVQPELFQPGALLRADEAHRQEHVVGEQLVLGARHLLEPAVDHLHAVDLQGAHPTAAVVDEPLGVHRVQTVTALLVGRRDLERHGELRPRVARRAGLGRL